MRYNGGQPTAESAELRDVFFTPGALRTKRLLQRDAHGDIAGFISRREGHDIIFKRVRAG